MQIQIQILNIALEENLSALFTKLYAFLTSITSYLQIRACKLFFVVLRDFVHWFVILFRL